MKVIVVADEQSILVWRFHAAPKYLQDMSSHGGDEDWLAFVPDTLNTGALWDDIPWLEAGTPFGVCDVSEHEVEGGTVYIGAHA